MTTPVQTGPAAWPLNTTGCTGWDQINADVKTAATDVATEVMWALSGRRFGLTAVTVRPCRRSCPDGADFWRLQPLLSELPFGWLAGSWCGCTAQECHCAPTLCEVGLAGPVNAVTEVKQDGTVVPATSYVVQDHRWLVRVDGECWPDCQDFTAGEDAPGAFVVTYQRGVPVPPGGQWAAGQLACEIAKAMTNDRECRLPRRVQSVVRQGVQRTFLDPAQLAKDGMTGLPEVDQWLGAVNPHRLPRDSVVWSPDLQPGRRRTA
jgi:hypothetical protein